MLKQLPRSLEWTPDGERVASLKTLLRWHAEAEDPYGRYCRGQPSTVIPAKAGIQTRVEHGATL